MTGPSSWAGSPAGPSHGLLQPDEGGHQTVHGPGWPRSPGQGWKQAAEEEEGEETPERGHMAFLLPTLRM